jgi:hypothetical protein
MRYQVFVLLVVLAVSGCGGSNQATQTASPAQPSAVNRSTSSTSQTTSGGSAPSTSPDTQPAPSVVLEAQTHLPVILDQAISSKDNAAGDRFEASLAAPLRVDGKEVIPAGSKVTGTVLLAHSAGRFKGNASLSVTLSSITAQGKTYDIQTSSHSENTKGRGERTAIGTGGGAAVGAIIGAIAGGGKGAAIGAGAGAGAGVTGAALTGNRDIVFPAESKIEFRLKKPLEISGS